MQQHCQREAPPDLRPPPVPHPAPTRRPSRLRRPHQAGFPRRKALPLPLQMRAPPGTAAVRLGNKAPELRGCSRCRIMRGSVKLLVSAVRVQHVRCTGASSLAAEGMPRCGCCSGAGLPGCESLRQLFADTFYCRRAVCDRETARSASCRTRSLPKPGGLRGYSCCMRTCGEHRV